MTQENTTSTQVKTSLGSQGIIDVAAAGLEMIAEKYSKPALLSGTKKLYEVNTYREGVNLIFAGSHSTSKIVREHPELVYCPIEVGVIPNQITIKVNHEFWQKEAEFLIELMKEVMPECFKQSSFRIVEDFLPAEN